MVVPKKGLEMLPALKTPNDDAFRSGHRSYYILRLPVTENVPLDMSRLELPSMMNNISVRIDK
jgi:hypothetical protein